MYCGKLDSVGYISVQTSTSTNCPPPKQQNSVD